MSRSLLVYDGRNGLFRRVAALVARCTDDLRPVRWESDAVQAFLDAQFDSRPFAFILVEGDSVHVGDEAVGRLLRKRGVGGTVAGALKRAYPAVERPLGRVVHGRETAGLHGTFPLTEAARARVEPLRCDRSIPVEAT